MERGERWGVCPTRRSMDGLEEGDLWEAWCVWGPQGETVFFRTLFGAPGAYQLELLYNWGLEIKTLFREVKTYYVLLLSFFLLFYNFKF